MNIASLQRSHHKAEHGGGAKLSKEERYDKTTKAFSRRFADGYIPDAFDIAVRTDRNISFALIEVVNLKEIHKRLADPDAIISEMAQVLEGTVRSGDVLSRYRDEQFLIILAGTTIDQAKMVCQRMYDAVKTLSQPSKKGPLGGITDIGIKLCIGVATHGLGCEFRNAEELLNAAQAALHTAKLTPASPVVEFNHDAD
jgi:diguanylate cyclase (GGDEF)-like protein